ncbi:MAG: hypothetical protein GF310_11030 [candidate division Zixibacteria bacterium]|nr:hypothetical protein [candidate division Zixibacteria bacterium]
MRYIFLSIILILIPVFLIGEETRGSADPQTGEQIKWQVVASGGSSTSSGSYHLSSTTSQASVGMSSSNSYQLAQGYWQDFGLGEPDFICGDANSDMTVNVSDAVYIINFVFIGGGPPVPYDSGDSNCDNTVNVSDAVWVINYVFIGGNDPCDTDGDSETEC